MAQTFDETTQQMVEKFNSRLEAMTVEHANILSHISAFSLLKDLEALQPPPPLSTRVWRGVGKAGKWVGLRVSHGRGQQPELDAPPLVVIEGTYRVLDDELPQTEDRDQ
jgi:hypothetical protein